MILAAEYIPSPLKLMLVTWEIGFPIPPGFSGKRGLPDSPDSESGNGGETGNPRFPIRPGPGIGVPGAAAARGRGFPGLLTR
jgi:hypothetical protein